MLYLLIALRYAEYGVDTCFGACLLYLLYRRRALFLDLATLRVGWRHIDRHSKWETTAYALHRWAYVWLGTWHLGESAYLYIVRSCDRLLVVHHMLTAALAAWIVCFEFYNGYSAIPLLFHYGVSASHLARLLTGGHPLYDSVYPFYVATYALVLAAGLKLNAERRFEYLSVREYREMMFIAIFTVIHMLNLVEFGFTTRISSAAALWLAIAVGACAAAIPAWALWWYTFGSPAAAARRTEWARRHAAWPLRVPEE